MKSQFERLVELLETNEITMYEFDLFCSNLFVDYKLMLEKQQKQAFQDLVDEYYYYYN